MRLPEPVADTLFKTGRTRLWGPQAWAVGTLLAKRMNDALRPVYDDIADAFRLDTTGDAEVDAAVVYDLFSGDPREWTEPIWEKSEEFVQDKLLDVAVNGMEHFREQRKKVVKLSTEEWEVYASLLSTDHVEAYVHAFPERTLLPVVERMVDRVIQYPDMREIDRAVLADRIEHFGRIAINHFAEVAGSFSGLLWNFAGLELAREFGIGQMMAISAGDRRVCAVCLRMHGKTVDIQVPLERMDQFLVSSPDVGRVKELFPYPRMRDVDNVSPDVIQQSGFMPPFHGRCRCDTVFMWL